MESQENKAIGVNRYVIAFNDKRLWHSTSYLERIGLLLEKLVPALCSLLLTLEDLLIHTRGRNFRHGAIWIILDTCTKQTDSGRSPLRRQQGQGQQQEDVVVVIANAAISHSLSISSVRTVVRKIERDEARGIGSPAR